MKLFSGKRGIIMGVANTRSIATGIAQVLTDQGAELAFSFLPDASGKMEARVHKAVGTLNPNFIHPCNVNDDEQIAEFFQKVEASWGQIDFLVHSIAFADLDEIRKPTVAVSRAGFLQAMEASVYSFIATTQHARKLLSPSASVLTLSYLGSEKCVPGYNLMGLAKAALESATRYLAYDLGAHGHRVNAISAGPIKTLAASAVGDLSAMLKMNAAAAPLRRTVSAQEVGSSAAYLLSELASGVTGETLHVDGGYNIMAATPPTAAC